jgi:hypothetical protein
MSFISGSSKAAHLPFLWKAAFNLLMLVKLLSISPTFLCLFFTAKKSPTQNISKYNMLIQLSFLLIRWWNWLKLVASRINITEKCICWKSSPLPITNNFYNTVTESIKVESKLFDKYWCLTVRKDCRKSECWRIEGSDPQNSGSQLGWPRAEFLVGLETSLVQALSNW